MSDDQQRNDLPDERPRKPPIFLKMADEGNIPGRPSPAALAFIVAVVAVGLAAIYFVNH